MTEQRSASNVGKALSEIEIAKAENVWGLFSKLGQNFVFRGQTERDWGLRTTFERAAEGIEGKDRVTLEQTVMTEFQRRAHHYLSDLPKEENRLEWLALMQHHGCPTRLLDFTRSFWVGLFFAVENAQSDCTFWAIDRSYVEKNLAVPRGEEHLHPTYVGEAEREANEILSSPPDKPTAPGILLVEPKRMNERLSIQQGLSLFPKDIHVSFEENLCTSQGCKSLSELAEKDGGLMVLKIVIPEGLCLEITYLLSTMNVNAATLFPGLDGFARSQMTYVKLAKLGRDRRAEFWRKVLSWLSHGAAVGSVARGVMGLVGAAFEGIAESEGRSPKKEQ